MLATVSKHIFPQAFTAARPSRALSERSGAGSASLETRSTWHRARRHPARPAVSRLAEPLLHTSEVVFEDRGEVDVKGATKPIRMFLAKSGDSTYPQEALDGPKTTDGNSSSGSRLLPYFLCHQGEAAAGLSYDGTHPDALSRGQQPSSSSPTKPAGWDSDLVVMSRWDSINSVKGWD